MPLIQHSLVVAAFLSVLCSAQVNTRADWPSDKQVSHRESSLPLETPALGSASALALVGNSLDAESSSPENWSALPILDGPPNPRRSRWYGRASVGFAYRWAFDQSMLGAALDGEIGAQNQRLAGGVRLHIEAGRLLAGLPFQVVTFGPNLWFRLAELFRIGLGLDTGVLVLSRRTVPDRSMWTVMLGGHLGGSLDIWRHGNSGVLHLDAIVGAYFLTQAPGPLSVVTTLGLGYRP